MTESSLHSTSSTNQRLESDLQPKLAGLVALNGKADVGELDEKAKSALTLDLSKNSHRGPEEDVDSKGGVSSDAADLDWQQILTENQSWLRRVLYSRLGELEAVDECMQEIGLAAVRQAAPIRDTSKVGSWLYQLAIRQSLLYRRKMGRKRNLLQRYAERNRPIESDQGAFDPLNWLLSREKVGTVRLALAEMKSDDREILLLKYGENWSYFQISEHLNVTHSAVEARLHRARQRLRKLIERFEKESQLNSD